MKYLGIDYGTKKIGLAVSDVRGNIAFPKKILPWSKNLVENILNLIEDEGVAAVVVGKSLDPWGSENSLQGEINRFIGQLSSCFKGEIIEQDERGSSVFARSHLYGKGNIENQKWTGKQNEKKRAEVDAGAAAIILQRFLDKKNKGKI